MKYKAFYFFFQLQTFSKLILYNIYICSCTREKVEQKNCCIIYRFERIYRVMKVVGKKNKNKK